jgi:hypothetical protein
MEVLVKKVSSPSFPQVGLDWKVGFSLTGNLVRFEHHLVTHLPASSNYNLHQQPNLLSHLFLEGFTPSALSCFERFRGELMSRPWDSTPYGFSTWKNPGIVPSPAFKVGSFQEAILQISFGLDAFEIPSEELNAALRTTAKLRSVRTVSALEADLYRVEQLNSHHLDGNRLPNNGPFSFYSTTHAK